MMSKLVGIALIIIGSSLNMISSGNLMLFVDIPSIIFVVCIILGSLLATLGFQKTIRFTQDLETQAKFFLVGRVSSIIAGVFGTLTSLVVMFNSMSDDIGISKMGLAIAVSILTLLYSCISYLIFFIWERSK